VKIGTNVARFNDGSRRENPRELSRGRSSYRDGCTNDTTRLYELPVLVKGINLVQKHPCPYASKPLSSPRGTK